METSQNVTSTTVSSPQTTPSTTVPSRENVTTVQTSSQGASLLPFARIAALAGLSALLLRNAENRACLANTVTGTVKDLGSTAASAGSAVASGTRKAAMGVQHTAGSVTGGVAGAVKPIPTAVASSVGSILSKGGSAVKSIAEKETRMIEHSKEAAREARLTMRDIPRTAEIKALVKSEVTRQLDQHLTHHHSVLEERLQKHFAQQEATMGALTRRLERLNKRSSGGGFPWTLALLGGAGYYLYRNPQLVQKIMDALEQVSPGAQENLQRVGQSVREGVEGVRRGENPGEVIRTTAQGVQQAVQKTVSSAQEKAQSGAQGGQTEGQPTGGAGAASMQNQQLMTGAQQQRASEGQAGIGQGAQAGQTPGPIKPNPGTMQAAPKGPQDNTTNRAGAQSQPGTNASGTNTKGAPGKNR